MTAERNRQDLVSALADVRAQLREIETKFEGFAQRLECSPVNVHRILRWFNREDDELVGSAPLHGINLTDLRRLFDVKDDDPMVDCYRVNAAHASQLQAYVDVPLLIDRYDYFVEADADVESE